MPNEQKIRPKLPPLRKVVETGGNAAGSLLEILECGHKVHAKQDIYEYTNAVRRRCKQCQKDSEPKR